MAEKGQIDLKQVKAKYKIDDFKLIDSRSLESADECRLYFEICFAISLTLIGSILSAFNVYLFISSLIFLLFGAFFLIRYIIKQKKILE